jgi:hypothetical protein
MAVPKSVSDKNWHHAENCHRYKNPTRFQMEAVKMEANDPNGGDAFKWRL